MAKITEAAMSSKSLRGIVRVSALAGLAVGGLALAQQAPDRGIVHVGGDLYRAHNNAHNTVFLVTSEGIVVSDPINRDFAEWLQGELASMYDVPVRVVAYSHYHWDHASGGEVFADTAEVVGHETMPGALAMPSGETPLSDAAAALDANGNGQIEESEASGNLAGQFALIDADGNGMLTGAEIARGPVSDVHPPSTVYSDTRTIALGGKSVELIHVAADHSPDMTVLRFPDEDAVFFVDIISVKRLPFMDFPGLTSVDSLVETIQAVEAIDFSVAVAGHGDIGTKEDVADHRRYIEELRDAVAAGMADGQSLEELQASITMDAYSDWGSFNWLPNNIAGMYRILGSGD